MSPAPCRNLASTGVCAYGSHCRFSHDTAAQHARPPPGQTPCFHWEESGTCPYGSRCAYLHKPRAPNSTKALYEDLCEKINELKTNDSTCRREEVVKTNFHVLASYDWVDASVPTIGIPGNPRKLSPPEMPLTIQPDSIAFARTPESDRTMDPYKFRLEALVQACMQTSPGMSFEGVDIICGLNNLRKIFDFACGKQKDAFRIDVEICTEILMMTRWDEDPKSLARTSLCRGYGRGFEEACTNQEEQDMKSTSHHRIFSYSLGGLSLIVQCEVDACDCHCSKQDSGKVPVRPSCPPPCTAAGVEVSFLGMDVPDISVPPLAVIDAGTKHRSACLVEIKSRDKKNTRMHDIMVQMWLSGLHRLYFGRHLRGKFIATDTYQKDVTLDLEVWQREHEKEIAIFVGLLKHVRQMVHQAASDGGSVRYALVFQRRRSGDRLELWRRENGQDLLQQETLAKMQQCPLQYNEIFES